MEVGLLVSCALLICITHISSDSTLHYREQKQTFASEEIDRYKTVARKLIDLSIKGNAQNQSYNRLAEFVDKFGSRLAGTDNLENSIDYVIDKLKADGLENVYGEPVSIPRWVRGSESARLVKPRSHSMSILGLGGSIGTPSAGITAEALVVKSFKELEDRASEAKGKIIVFNEDWAGSYGKTVAYRSGAVQAAEAGGIASLIRSITPFSIYSPHTGSQTYKDNVTKIPTACITIEDAEMMSRMAKRGEKITIHLQMEAHSLENVDSRNVIAEIKGTTYPDEVVIVSGHIDSWDVGQGAMDDGTGAFVSWQALSLIHQLNLRPKRTLRVIFWTAEEEGLVGANQYYINHKADLDNIDLIMESDEGTFSPSGFQFTGNDEATSIMRKIVNLLEPLGATNFSRSAGVSDVVYWLDAGVPTGSLFVDSSKYFYFHHSNGDTMTVLDPHEMNVASAIFAVVSYVVADIADKLPR